MLRVAGLGGHRVTVEADPELSKRTMLHTSLSRPSPYQHPLTGASGTFMRQIALPAASETRAGRPRGIGLPRHTGESIALGTIVPLGLHFLYKRRRDWYAWGDLCKDAETGEAHTSPPPPRPCS